MAYDPRKDDRYYAVFNRNLTCVWHGTYPSLLDAWAAFRKDTKVPDDVSTEELEESPNTQGRYGLRMVSWNN